jgi:hypothetical protein
MYLFDTQVSNQGSSAELLATCGASSMNFLPNQTSRIVLCVGFTA